VVRQKQGTTCPQLSGAVQLLEAAAPHLQRILIVRYTLGPRGVNC
jgi:hypothetical protein